jgi:hypothetical protein
MDVLGVRVLLARCARGLGSDRDEQLASAGLDAVAPAGMADAPQPAGLEHVHLGVVRQLEPRLRERVAQVARHFAGVEQPAEADVEGESARRDGGLEHLVHQVHVGQRRVGVLACQLDLAEVGTPREQDVLGGLGPLCIALLEEVQDVRQVGGGADHRGAVPALAEVGGSEQGLPVGNRGRGRRRLLDRGNLQRVVQRHQHVRRGKRACRGAAMEHARLVVSHRGRVARDERLLADLGDRSRGVEPVRAQQRHVVVAGSERQQALEGLDRGDGLLVGLPAGIGEVLPHRTAGEREVRVSLDEGGERAAAGLARRAPEQRAVGVGGLEPPGELRGVARAPLGGR